MGIGERKCIIMWQRTQLKSLALCHRVIEQTRIAKYGLLLWCLFYATHHIKPKIMRKANAYSRALVAVAVLPELTLWNTCQINMQVYAFGSEISIGKLTCLLLTRSQWKVVGNRDYCSKYRNQTAHFPTAPLHEITIIIRQISIWCISIEEKGPIAASQHVILKTKFHAQIKIENL